MIEGLKPLYSAALRPTARLLQRLGVHPNVLTCLGVVVFAVAGWVTYIGRWRMALLIGLAGAFMDGLDGLVAREGGRKSRFGAVLDSVCDRLTEIVWIGWVVAYYLRASSGDSLPILLGFAAITGSLMVSYVKARAEGMGIVCNRGLMQRPERLILLAGFQFAGPVAMPWGLGLVAALSYLTVFQRMVETYRGARKISP